LTNKGYVDGRTRILVTGTLSLYVRPDGNDNNDGSANNAAHAFATPVGALRAIQRGYDLRGYNVTINLADGEYPAFTWEMTSTVGGLGGIGSGIRIVGQGQNSIIGSANDGYALHFLSPGPALGFSNLRLRGISALALGHGAQGYLEGAIWLETTGRGFYTYDNGYLFFYGGVTINQLGAQTSHMFQVAEGKITSWTEPYPVINHLVPCALPDGVTYVSATNQGEIGIYGLTVTGSVTGRRYHATTQGIINTHGGGENFFPGTIAGVVRSELGAIYV
jgi:hypothetical protein